MSVFSCKRSGAANCPNRIMANIKIPKEAIPVLRTIIELDQKSFDSALTVIASESPTLKIFQFIKRISPKLDGQTEESILEILAVIIPLYAIKENKGVSLQQLVEDICVAAADLADEKFPIGKIDLLKLRLKSLLSLDKPLAVIAKANEVMTQHEKLFCEPRIFSDIRSVFTETPDSASGAMVVHMLQIGFHQLGKHKDFYVAMDNDDLKKLKEAIERAERKTLALRTSIEKSNVPYLEV
jgi:hypothetical protein